MDNNHLVRQTAQERHVRLWQIAEQLGMTDQAFSRKLRHEFSDRERAKVLAIIEAIAEARKDADNDE